jgi:hypothetical protein
MHKNELKMIFENELKIATVKYLKPETLILDYTSHITA